MPTRGVQVEIVKARVLLAIYSRGGQVVDDPENALLQGGDWVLMRAGDDESLVKKYIVQDLIDDGLVEYDREQGRYLPSEPFYVE